MAWTHLDDGLGDERVKVWHQFAVDVGHVEVLSDHGDETHGSITDPQVGMTQERSWDQGEERQTVRTKVNNNKNDTKITTKYLLL